MNYTLQQPLCRGNDPLTSFEAADAAKELIKTHERLIVSVLAEHGPLGVDGIAARCSLEPHAVGKRMIGLERNVYVRLTGEYVTGQSGRRQRQWEAM